MGNLQLFPYVNFQGRAREALQLYHELLGLREVVRKAERKSSKRSGATQRSSKAT